MLPLSGRLTIPSHLLEVFSAPLRIFVVSLHKSFHFSLTSMLYPIQSWGTEISWFMAWGSPRLSSALLLVAPWKVFISHIVLLDVCLLPILSNHWDFQYYLYSFVNIRMISRVVPVFVWDMFEDIFVSSNARSIWGGWISLIPSAFFYWYITSLECGGVWLLFIG